MKAVRDQEQKETNREIDFIQETKEGSSPDPRREESTQQWVLPYTWTGSHNMLQVS